MHRHRVLCGVVCATGLLMGVSAARAAEFVVNSTADLGDANPGNGVCAASSGACTLRAALDEADATVGMDIVTVPAGTYALTEQLVIDDSVFLNGAGMGSTILDGQLTTEVMHVRTLEALVCDGANDRVQSFDVNGQLNRTVISSGFAGLDSPIDLVLRSDGEIYVVGFTSGVHRYESDGAPGSLFSNPPPLGPTSAAFGTSTTDFDLFVTQFQPAPNGVIKRYDRDTGALVSTFVPDGPNAPSFPNSIAFHDGDLFVSAAGSHEILRYDGATGAFLDTFVSSFSGPLSTPREFTFFNGSLYVTSEDTDSVLEYNGTTGAFQRVFVSSGSGGLDEPFALDFGFDGDLYVISGGTDQILRYDGSSGAFKGVFVSGGNFMLGTPTCITWRAGAGDGPIVNISGLAIARGRASTGFTAGLTVDDGASVALTEVSVRDNDSSSFGGGIQNWGVLDLLRSEVVRNVLPEGGGGQTSQGGGIFNAGNLTIEQTLVADNYATRGGGISNVNDGRIEIIDSTISGNRANGAGGGIRNVVNGLVFITFSTITNNRANEPGGSGESNRIGGGIYNLSPARVSMANTILAGNFDNRSRFEAEYAPDCYSPNQFEFTSERDNIIGILTPNCVFKDVIFGDDSRILSGTATTPLDPRLGPLASNGGALRSHALLTGSPAIEGDVSVTSATFYDCRDEDMRELPRPIDGDLDGVARCDLGAFEFQPPDDNDGVSAAIEDAAPNGGDGNDDGIPDRLQPSVTSLPAGAGGGYVTVEASEGSVLSNVRTAPAGSPPRGVLLPHGRVGFTVTADPAATITITFPEGEPITSYWKFGATAGQTSDHWYQFGFDGSTGASISGNVVTLQLRDGQRGDDDLSVNAVVVDDGAPAVADSDEDGLSDAREAELGTDPNDPDSDDDGLRDGAEQAAGTDPLDADSDDDGLPDGLEVDVAHTDPLDPDSDDDGLPDGRDPSVIIDMLEALPDSAFKARALRSALILQLRLAERSVSLDLESLARVQLAHPRRHFGCGVRLPFSVWISSDSAQDALCAVLEAQLTALRD